MLSVPFGTVAKRGGKDIRVGQHFLHLVQLRLPYGHLTQVKNLQGLCQIGDRCRQHIQGVVPGIDNLQFRHFPNGFWQLIYFISANDQALQFLHIANSLRQTYQSVTAHIQINQLLKFIDTAIQSLYAHLSKKVVKPGQKVKRGELIGYVGNTGLSFGPHLHYEVIKNGVKVNPVHYFFDDITPEEYDAILESSKIVNQALS